MSNSLFSVGETVQYNGRLAKIIAAESSGNPCPCCGRLDHNPSLLATVRYLDDGVEVSGIDFRALSKVQGGSR